MGLEDKVYHATEDKGISRLSFVSLSGASFMGALNDNVFKLLLIYFLMKQSSADLSQVMAPVGFVFAVPYLLFLAWSGNLADRMSKRHIIVVSKALEVLSMMLGCAAFASGHLWAAFVVLFLMSAQSAIYGPSKYGIIPELVNREQLSKANGLIEMLTFVAIIVGTGLAPFLSSVTNENFGIAGLICVGISAAGLWMSILIKPTPAAGGRKRSSLIFFKVIFETLGSIRSNRPLMLSVMASACFMLVGAFIQMNVMPYGVSRLGLSEEHSTYLFLPAALGIGLGSLLAGRLSGRGVEIGLIPMGTLILGLSQILLGWTPATATAVGAVIFLGGFGGGLFIVPIQTLIQTLSDRKSLGKVLAASGFLGWVGVLAAAGMLYLLNVVLELEPAQSNVVMGVLTLGLMLVMLRIVPEFFVRLLLFIATRVIYRIRTSGIENVPIQGGGLLVANHVTLVDGLLLNATQHRMIRFVMAREQIAKIRWLRWLFRLVRVIPVSEDDPPRQLLASIREVREALASGDLVCVFAEGHMTHTGTMLSFKGGVEKMVKGLDVPIIPVYIGGAWGSIFSLARGKGMRSLPWRLPYPVSIHYGKPLASGIAAFSIRQEVLELSCEYYESLKRRKRTLAREFVRSARRNWRRKAVADVGGKTLSYGRLLTGAYALASKLRGPLEGDRMVGIALPSSSGGCLANLAVSLLGKVAVNLNFTASAAAIRTAEQQCEMRHAITSRLFLKKLAGFDVEVDKIYLEEVAKSLTGWEKIRAYLKARFVPMWILRPGGGVVTDDLATVIFSSGSTGEPKGVMLSHHNILSNIEGFREVLPFTRSDNFCGILPFFHSFGYTVTLWLPLAAGMSVVYVPNPLSTKSVSEAIEGHQTTYLLGTPTFLMSYTRRIQREVFSSLKLVVAGAEKLQRMVADAFEEKFGMRPLEGYGITELSPVVSLNLPNVKGNGFTQIGNKEGSVGHPIPGVTVKVVDTETGAELGAKESGELWVKGPNVMQGYLNDEAKTSKTITDGWYHTGDIGHIDEDGFITIVDRLSRFCKIGGEMVSHVAVEQAYQEGLGTGEQVVAVTSIRDASKGEQLAVLYMEAEVDAKKLHEIITRSDLPNLWKPRRDHYIPIESMPLLGTGKLDLRALKRLAEEAMVDT